MSVLWYEATLNDVCYRITDGAHASPKSVDRGLPMASVKDMTPYGLNLETARQISAEDFAALVRQGCKPLVGDVLIAKDGATALDTVCVIQQPIETVLLSSVAILRPNADVVLPKFLRYYLDAESTRAYMKAAFTTGAAIPRVVLKDFKRARIRYPDMATQARICAALSAYDDLIENNTRRIAILEEMARRIYEEWFVRFRFPGHENVRMVESELGLVPEGWELTSLGAVAENHDRFRRPLSKMERADFKGPYPYYGAAKIFDYVREYLFDGQFLLLAEDGSVETPDGHPVLQLTDGKFWANNHTHILQGTKRASTEFLYLRLERQPIRGYITGAAQPKLTQAAINRIPLVLPPSNVLREFDAQVQPLFQFRATLIRANTNLRTTRDLLLPQLISGELSVESIEMAREAP